MSKISGYMSIYDREGVPKALSQVRVGDTVRMMVSYMVTGTTINTEKNIIEDVDFSINTYEIL